MANLKDLASVLADLDARDAAQVAHCARQVRKAGQLAPSKPGLGAAALTVSDVASVLIAVMASERPRDAAPVVRRYSALRYFRKVGVAGELGEWAMFPELAICANFGEALCQAIGGAREIANAFSAYVERNHPDLCQSDAEKSRVLGRMLRRGWLVSFSVTLQMTTPAAKFTLSAPGALHCEWLFGELGAASITRQATIDLFGLLKIAAAVFPSSEAQAQARALAEIAETAA